MPPFANGLDSFSGVVQEQVPGSDLDQVSTIETGSLGYSNLFSGSERKDDLANPVDMVEWLQTAQRLHSMGSQALRNMVDMYAGPNKVEGGHDFSLLFDKKKFDANRKIPIVEEEDRKEIGVLIRRLESHSYHMSSQGKFVRKRSHSIMESEDLDQSGRVRSYTSSESDVGAGDDGAADGHYRLKVPKTETLVSPEIGKELLSLSLPVSSINSESSCSSRELDLQLHSKSDACVRRSCSIYFASENDVAESNMLNSAALTSMPSEHDEQAMEQRVSSADDAAGETSTHSSTEPTSPMTHREDEPAVQLTLQLDSLKPILKPNHGRIPKFLPVTGKDAITINQVNLLNVLDSRLESQGWGLQAHGLQLRQMLTKCASAMEKCNLDVADKLLGDLNQGMSLYGDSFQRVAAYFAEGLTARHARLVNKKEPIYADLMVQPSIEDYFSAFTTLYRVAPYFQFAHFTANQAILEALEGHKNVHVIDMDIMQGLQWAPLIQSLASRPGGPPHLRITGVGKHSKVLGETGRRLASFAATFEVPFEFHALVEEKLENLTPDAFALRSGEAVAVNSVMQLHRLLNPSSGEKLHNFMHSLIRKVNPRVVTLVEQEANHNNPSFFGRFTEALNYYAAVFDLMDASLPQQNEERVKVEQVFFAQQIKNIVVFDGDERVERHETIDLWEQRMQIAGFAQVPLSSHSVSQARLLIQSCPCDGYRLHERTGSISLGWQDRQLLTASAWSCS